jgi:hypothetical protein
MPPLCNSFELQCRRVTMVYTMNVYFETCGVQVYTVIVFIAYTPVEKPIDLYGKIIPVSYMGVFIILPISNLTCKNAGKHPFTM